MGDGAMILLPTSGQTAGSMFMLIRQDGWHPIPLVGDLSSEATLQEQDVVPSTGDREMLLVSFAKPRQLKARLPGLTIVASRDFSAEEALLGATRGASI